MNVLIVLLLALAAVLSNDVLAASDQMLLTAADQSIRTRFLGFSIQPPDGQDWRVQEQGFSWITHVKSPTRSGRHTVLLSARSQPVELGPGETSDFLLYVNRVTLITNVDPRYQDVSRTVSTVTIDRAQCAKVNFSAQDRGVPWAPGEAFHLQGFDIYCLHPHSPHSLVILMYSQRFEKSRTPIAVDTEVISFIESLRFSPEISKRFSIGPLLGSFAYDKAIFFPNGRNQTREMLLLGALKESGYESGEVFSPSQESTQRLAIEYDVAWLLAAEKGVTPGLGCVLGKVERWNEALKAFEVASENMPKSVDILGHLAVASHVLGRYSESSSYFQRAIAADSGYFDNRPKQKSIYEASEKGVSMLGR